MLKFRLGIMFNLIKIPSGYEVRFKNGKLAGQFEISDDGFYYFWPEFEKDAGYLSPYILRELADELDRLNQPWNDEIYKWFSLEEIKDQI